MRRRILGLIAISIPMVAGCQGESANPRASVSVSTQGTVDTSLPRDDRSKQKVVHDILVNFQEGMPPSLIPTVLKGVRFVESEEEFLEGTNMLVRWDFDGRPSQGRVPVVLYFAEGSNAELKKVQRAYQVKGSGGRYLVSRG